MHSDGTGLIFEGPVTPACLELLLAAVSQPTSRQLRLPLFSSIPIKVIGTRKFLSIWGRQRNSLRGCFERSVQRDSLSRVEATRGRRRIILSSEINLSPLGSPRVAFHRKVISRSLVIKKFHSHIFNDASFSQLSRYRRVHREHFHVSPRVITWLSQLNDRP